jgi:hypothetical protein
MALKSALQDREFDKFEDVAGETAVRVKQLGSFTVTPSGLTVGGLITVVSINPTTWTALPATPLANRNAINIQNYNGQEIKLQYDNSTVGYSGVIIPINGERQYSITDDILLYAKSASSTIDIIVEEIA